MSQKSWLRHSSLWVPPLVYVVVIFHLSSESNPLPELTSIVWDKALHAIEYAGLALLVGRAFTGEGLGWAASSALAVLLASAYGASDEWHQLFTPWRDPNVFDWMADTLGAGVGVAVYWLSEKCRGHRAVPRRIHVGATRN